MIVTQYVLSSSRHLVTPLIYIHFCVWLGLFVDRWWLKEVWYAPDFCETVVLVFPLLPGITRIPNKRTCCGTLSEKTRNWPTCKPVHIHERSRKRRRNFDPAYSVDNLTQAGVLLRKQDVLMPTLMVNLVALSPHSQRSTYRGAHAVPSSSIVDLALRCQAVKANSFGQVRSPKKNNEEVSDWYHESKHWLFATFASLFSSLRARSRCLPSFASRRRLLGWRQQSFRTRVADPASISTISEPRKTTKRC